VAGYKQPNTTSSLFAVCQIAGMFFYDQISISFHQEQREFGD
jgi:hypothetical protein